jgi:hypothetical protein
MSSAIRSKSIGLALTCSAAALLIFSLGQPLWQLRMEAPQYRDNEALKVTVFPNALRGDLGEIKVLNQYIGVHIPSQLPQLRWLPIALIAASALGVVGALLPRRWRSPALVIVPVLLSGAIAAAAAQAQYQMYEIGHKRDTKTKLAGFKDFSTPLLGRAKIAQFEVEASLGAGACLIGAAMVLQLSAAWAMRQNKAAVARRDAGRKSMAGTAVSLDTVGQECL